MTYTVTVTPDRTREHRLRRGDRRPLAGHAVRGRHARRTASQGTATLAGDTLTWNVGTVSGTTPLTLTYTATVKDGAYGATLRNHVTADR